MAINFKPINELPEIESVSDGDKLLVNSGGMAKQIDASKFAGSGSGSGSGGAAGVIYIDMSEQMEGEDGIMTTISGAFSDVSLSTPYTYEQGKALLLCGNAMACVEEGAVNMCLLPTMFVLDDDAHSAMVMVAIAGDVMQFAIGFAE